MTWDKINADAPHSISSNDRSTAGEQLASTILLWLLHYIQNHREDYTMYRILVVLLHRQYRSWSWPILVLWNKMFQYDRPKRGLCVWWAESLRALLLRFLRETSSSVHITANKLQWWWSKKQQEQQKGRRVVRCETRCGLTRTATKDKITYWCLQV